MRHLLTDSTAVLKFECKYRYMFRVNNLNTDNKNNFWKAFLAVLCAFMIATSVVVFSLLVSFGNGNDTELANRQ